MPVRPVLRNRLGSPHCYQAYSTPCWWKPGARSGKPHSKGFLKKSSQHSHAFLPPWEEGATLAEAVQRLPAMRPLLASLSQVIWASNIDKSSLRPWSVSHAPCDSLCTQGLNTGIHHLPLSPCTGSLQTSATQFSTVHIVPCNLHWFFNGSSCPLEAEPSHAVNLLIACFIQPWSCWGKPVLEREAWCRIARGLPAWVWGTASGLWDALWNIIHSSLIWPALSSLQSTKIFYWKVLSYSKQTRK